MELLSVPVDFSSTDPSNSIKLEYYILECDGCQNLTHGFNYSTQPGSITFQHVTFFYCTATSVNTYLLCEANSSVIWIREIYNSSLAVYCSCLYTIHGQLLNIPVGEYLLKIDYEHPLLNPNYSKTTFSSNITVP
jgi:hypothetical protein